MKLIIGLGNPGVEYEKTRHNAGFMVVDKLSSVFGFSDFKKMDKFKAFVAEGEIAGEKTFLVKPITFMNLSGQAVQALVNFYKIDLRDLLVIYDEVDVPIGKLRIRPTGSAGGQKGIGSIIQELGSVDVPRIRIGIQPEKPFPGDLSDYVLGRFTTDQQILLDELIEKLPIIVELIFKEGIQAGMNRFN